MIQVATVQGSDEVINNLLYTPHTEEEIDYFRQNMNAVVERLQGFNDAFVNKVKETYNRVWDYGKILAAKAAASSVDNVIDHNRIRPLFKVRDIQHAPPIMQRWIMAQPDVRELYIGQGCQGYPDTYVDIDPGTVGEDNYDYRRVMDGIVQKDPNKDRVFWVNYSEELLEGDKDLDDLEKFTILNIWDIVKDAIAEGIDPTDPDEGEL